MTVCEMSNNYNFFSIIIPVVNGEKYIGSCLEMLSSLEYPAEKKELILVDNGSRDRTVDIAKRYSIVIHIKPKLTISALRNFGAQQARGNILVFIDVDCIAPRDWLSYANSIFNEKVYAAAIGAEYSLPDKPSFIEKVWDVQIQSRRRCGEVDWLPSGNMFVHREAFEQINGFNVNLSTCEDYDFCQRLKKAGYALIADASVSVVHKGNPKTLLSFFRKQLWHGTGAVQNFTQRLPRVKLNNALLFGVYTVVCVVSVAFGVVMGLAGGNRKLFALGIILIFIPPVLLALRCAFITKICRYFLPLSFLYLVYGIARAVCMLDVRNYVLNRGKNYAA